MMQDIIDRFNGSFEMYMELAGQEVIYQYLRYPDILPIRAIQNIMAEPKNSITLLNHDLLTMGFMETKAILIPNQQIEIDRDDLEVSGAMIYKHRVWDPVLFQDFVESGMKLGYGLRLDKFSMGHKKLSSVYLSYLINKNDIEQREVRCDDIGVVFTPDQDRMAVYDNVKTIESLLYSEIMDDFVRVKHYRPVIIELHERPFVSREINLLDAIEWYCK